MQDTTTWKVGCIGECMMELQHRTEGISMTFGGDTLNTAVYMARLGTQVQKCAQVAVEYITALGDDTFSATMLDFWQAENVGSSLVRRLKGKLPGLYFIELAPDGERRFSYWRGEAAARECFDAPGAESVLQALGDFDALYLSGISLGVLRPEGRKALVQRLRQLSADGVRIFFDFNYRPRLWGSTAEEALAVARPWYSDVMSFCHTALLTEDEAYLPDAGIPAGGEAACRALAALGAREVVIKNGDKECFVLAEGLCQVMVPSTVENVVDTTAAGDSFSAAYLVGRHLGLSPVKALGEAHVLASCVIAHHGAVISCAVMPSLFENRQAAEQCSTVS